MNNTKQISELFDYQPKSGRKAGDGLDEGLVPFYTSGQTQSKYLNIHDFEGDSLVLGTGGKPSVHFATGKFSATNDCFVIKPKNEDEIHPKYLYYYFLNKMYLLENGFRGAGLKHLSRSYFNDLHIPIFDYHTSQLRIIDILDKADALRQKRKESIKIPDDFLRSTFLEMFNKNERQFNSDTIINLLKKNNSIRTGPFGTQLKVSEFTTSGIPVLGIDNVVKNEFDKNYKRYLPEKKYNEFKKYRVFPRDVIITIMGTTGRVVVAPDDLTECMSTKHLCVLTFNDKIINPIYIWGAILFDPNVKKQTLRQGKGAIMEGWNMTIIKELKFIVPPIDLQNKFADIVHQVEKVKAKYNESERELDNLFGSLMQRAFKGEL